MKRLQKALLKSITIATLPLMMLGLSSCNMAGSHSGQYSTTYDPPAYRPQNPRNVRVKVSTSKQRIYVVEGKRVLMATPCSVGTPQAPTPPGNHTIYAKTFNRRSHSYGEYPLPNWCEFAPAYGFHWGFVKPYPCTHGCIRMPKMAAAKFFQLVSIGTPVNVASSQPEDSTIGASLPVLDDTTLPNPPNSYMMSNQVFEDAKYKGKMFVD